MDYGVNQYGKQPPVGSENVDINRQREFRAQVLTANKATLARQLPPMTKANYGAGQIEEKEYGERVK